MNLRFSSPHKLIQASEDNEKLVGSSHGHNNQWRYYRSSIFRGLDVHRLPPSEHQGIQRMVSLCMHRPPRPKAAEVASPRQPKMQRRIQGERRSGPYAPATPIVCYAAGARAKDKVAHINPSIHLASIMYRRLWCFTRFLYTVSSTRIPRVPTAQPHTSHLHMNSWMSISAATRTNDSGSAISKDAKTCLLPLKVKKKIQLENIKVQICLTHK
jgi:hypothetical protein